MSCAISPSCCQTGPQSCSFYLHKLFRAESFRFFWLFRRRFNCSYMFLICWVCDQFQLCLTPLACPGSVPEACRVKSGHCPLLTSLTAASISTSSPRGFSLSALCTSNNKNLLHLLSQHFLQRRRTARNPHILSARPWNLNTAACSLLSSVAANLRCCLANQMASATDISGPSQLST